MQIKSIIEKINNLDFDEKVDAINSIKEQLHDISPFKNEPVDFVKWVKNESVIANEYNPNKVAPPEMELLEISIMNDGYTQPVVTYSHDDVIEVVDGFHRTRVAKESKLVGQRVNGYVPVVSIRNEQTSKNDRIASTIRHNRARGKHQIDAMSEIVIELKNRNWRNSRIARELGMDEEEVLRMCQISGLENLFSDNDFSKAWEADDYADDWEDLTDEIADNCHVRIPHMDDKTRIFHTYHDWECHKAGFYASNFEGKTANECKEMYAEFLSDNDKFKVGLDRVITEWKNSCEHYLTNFAMNRIAWLGQAAMCIETGVPSKYCSGFNLLTEDQKDEANLIALDFLNEWMRANDRDELTLDEGLSLGRQVEIY